MFELKTTVNMNNSECVYTCTERTNGLIVADFENSKTMRFIKWTLFMTGDSFIDCEVIKNLHQMFSFNGHLRVNPDISSVAYTLLKLKVKNYKILLTVKTV